MPCYTNVRLFCLRKHHPHQGQAFYLGLYLKISLRPFIFHSVFKPVGSCHSRGSISVPAGTGYLSSQVTDDTGCGSMDHPWLIEISQGQHARLLLINFAGGEGIDCTTYGYISEPSSGANSSICGGLSEENELYTSTSNRVKIQIVNPQTRGNGVQFLLKYEGKDRSGIPLSFCAVVEISECEHFVPGKDRTDDPMLGQMIKKRRDL